MVKNFSPSGTTSQRSSVAKSTGKSSNSSGKYSPNSVNNKLF